MLCSRMKWPGSISCIGRRRKQMLYVNGTRMLREDEKRGLDELLFGRRTPHCPSCLCPMDLLVEAEEDGTCYVGYVCNLCGDWETRPVRGLDLFCCVEQAYLRATGHLGNLEKERTYLTNQAMTRWTGAVSQREEKNRSGAVSGCTAADCCNPEMTAPCMDSCRRHVAWKQFIKKASMADTALKSQLCQ